MPNNEYKLTQEIIKRSVAKTWKNARTEWELESAILSDEPEACLCSHYPILEICTLINRENGKKAVVGNCCVKKFLNLPSNEIFSAIKRVQADNRKSMNRETLDYAFAKGWITPKDMDFYSDTLRKLKLSSKQRKWRIDINERVLRRIEEESRVRRKSF
jgi:hypothetical protein